MGDKGAVCTLSQVTRQAVQRLNVSSGTQFVEQSSYPVLDTIRLLRP